MVETKVAELALEGDRPRNTVSLGVSVVKENDGETERTHYFRRRRKNFSNSSILTMGASRTENISGTSANTGLQLKEREIEIPDIDYVDLTEDSPHSNGKTLAASAEIASPELCLLRRHHRASYRKPRTASVSRMSTLHSSADTEIWIVGSEPAQMPDLGSGFGSLQEVRNEVRGNNNVDYGPREAASSSEHVDGALGISRARSLSEEKMQKESIPSDVSKQVIGCSSDPERVRGRKRQKSSLTDTGTRCQRFKPPRNVQDCSTNASSLGVVELPIEIDISESPSSSASAENCTSASPNTAKQIKEDELLAKFLQQDFGLEASGGVDDANFARMLQEEENTRYMQRRVASSPQTDNVSVMRAAGREMQRVIPTIRSQARPASSSRMRILRNLHNRNRQHAVRGGRHGGSSMDSNEHLLHFPEELDLETRVELLAALETVSQGTSTMLDHVDREFNEHDYEMLLALDDANCGSSGASYHKIEQLPISVIKPTDVYQETCSICLEMPVVDDVVRRLPCMHGFHLQCIDEWLGRQANCPICKMKI